MPCHRDARKLPANASAAAMVRHPSRIAAISSSSTSPTSVNACSAELAGVGFPAASVQQGRLAKAAMAHLAERLLEQCETLRACVARQALEKLIYHDGRELAARRLGGGLVIVHASECGEATGRCQWNETLQANTFI